MKSFVKVNSRGAITIPVAMRRELGVRTSDRFQIESKTDGTFSLFPEDAACIFCGKKESKRTRMTRVNGRLVCATCMKRLRG